MSIATEIERLNSAKASIKASIENKGVEVGDGTLDTYASKIDEIQVGGDDFEITDCSYLFYTGARIDLIDLFLPKCKNMTKAESMFSSATYNNTLDLRGLNLSKCTNISSMFNNARIKKVDFTGVDFSNITSIGQMFQNAQIEEIVTDIINSSKCNNMGYMFYNANKLITCPQLDCSFVSNFGSQVFYGCTSLVNFGGLKEIGKNYVAGRVQNYSSYVVSFSDSPNLSHESLMNIINNLYDIASKGCNKQSLVLGATNLAKLTEEEIAIATNKGWNVS